jgi:hypothetical protein
MNTLEDDMNMNMNMETTTTITITAVKVLTEDLGKIFEKGVCLLYGIEYDGKYKYSVEEAQKITARIVKLKDVFPHNLTHSAKNGSQYDFTGADDAAIRLSAKTTKKDGKVCPQVIGQPSRKKFCDFFGLDQVLTLEQIKQNIQENLAQMLAIYFKTTFDCPIVYYNKKKDLLLFIKTLTEIDWTQCVIEFSHIKKNKVWGESSTISINNKTIGEFQVHNHRDCIKFRWAFENLIEIFKAHFEIVAI